MNLTKKRTWIAAIFLALAPVLGVWGATTQVATSAALTDAVSAASPGDTIQLTADVTLSATLEITKSITLDLNGRTLTKSLESTSDKTPVIKALSGTVEIKNGTITYDISTYTGTGAQSNANVINVGMNMSNGVYSYGDCTLTLNGVNASVTFPKGKSLSMIYVESGKLNVIDSNLSADNISGNTSAQHVIYTTAHASAVVDPYVSITGTTTIDTNGKPGIHAIWLQGSKDTLVISGDDVTINADATWKPNSYSTLYAYAVNNQSGATCTIEGGKFAGKVWQTKGTITVYGGNFSYPQGTSGQKNKFTLAEGVEYVENTDPATKDAYPYVAELPSVARIGSTTYSSLADAMNAAATAATASTVEVLVSEIDCSGWTPVTVNSSSKLVTLDGNGVVLKNLSAPLFSKSGSGVKGVVVKNVTVKDANISTSSYAAAFLPYADSVETASFENCHIVDSTITSTERYAAGFVAYAAGYNNQNDGPVFSTVTIKDCSVKNSTITGANSTGGLMGHATGNAWTLVDVSGTEVAGNTVVCTDSSDKKAGALVGTVGVAGQEDNGRKGGIVVGGDSVVTNNAMTSGGVATDRIFGRIGSTGGELAVTGGTYDGTATYADDTYDSTVGRIVISGGSFATAPSADAVAEGYAVADTPNAQGYYTLEALPPVALLITDNGTTTNGYYTLAAALEAAASAGANATVEVAEGTYDIASTVSLPAGLTLKGAGANKTTFKITTANGDGIKITQPNVTIRDATIDGSAITSGGYKSLINVEADGAVIDNVVMTGGGQSTWNSSILVEQIGSTATFTVRNSTISGSFRGVLRESCNANIVIENCDIDAVYPFNIDGGSGGTVTVNDSALHGWTSYSGVDSVTFANCQFSKANSGYDVVAAYVDTTFTNCTFDSSAQIYAQTTGFTFELEECTKNGTALTWENMPDNFIDSDVWNKCDCYVDSEKVAFIAQIGDRIYNSLESALAAAQDGDTVTLLANCDVDSIITIAPGLELTLDLNGKTISNKVTDGRMITVGSGASLTVDGTTAGSGMVIPASNTGSWGFFKLAPSVIENDEITDVTTLVLNGGSYSGDTDNGAFIRPDNSAYASIELNNVTMDTNYRFVACGSWTWSELSVTNGVYTHNNKNVRNNGGVVPAFYLAGYESLFKDVTITSQIGPCVEVAGYTPYTEALFTGDNVFTVLETCTDQPWNNVAIAVDSNGKATIESGTYTSAGYGLYTFTSGGYVTITGGTFSGEIASVMASFDNNTYGQYGWETATEITGGTFNGPIATDGANSTITVSGGDFDQQVPAAYCAAGYEPTTEPDEQGYYTVQVEAGKVARNVTQNIAYTTLSDAASAAQAGDTIQLLRDAADAGAITLPAGATLDGNGFALSGNVYITLDSTGGTVKNVNFSNVRPSRGEITSVISATPAADAVYTITGNTFTTPGAVNQVLIEAASATDFSATITDNAFNTGTKTKRAFAVVNAADAEKLTLSGNYIASGLFFGASADGANVSEAAYPQLASADAEEATVALPTFIVKKNATDSKPAIFGYATLAAAFDGAATGDTILMTADASIDASVQTTKALTIDGQNHKLSATDSWALKGVSQTLNGVTTYGAITIQNVTLECADCGYSAARFAKVTVGSGVVIDATAAEGFTLKAESVAAGTELKVASAKVERGQQLLGTVAALADVTVTGLGDTTYIALDGGYLTVTQFAAKIGDTYYATLAEAAAAADAAVANGAPDPAITILDERLTSAPANWVISGTSLVRAVAKIGDSYYATLEDAVTAAQTGDTIEMIADYTMAAELNIIGKSIDIDLGGHTLKITANANRLASGGVTTTISNGTIDISGVGVTSGKTYIFSAGHPITGGANGGNTINIVNVTLTGTNYNGYSVFGLYDNCALNIENSTVGLTNCLYTSGGFVKSDARGYNVPISIVNSEIDLVNTQRGGVDGQFAIVDSTINLIGDATIANGTTAKLDNGFNQSGLALTNSTVTIRDGSGRGVTLNSKDIVVADGSTLAISDMEEGDIMFKGEYGADTLVAIGASTVTADTVVLKSGVTETVDEILYAADATSSVPTFEAQIGRTPYRKLTQAIAAAQDGDTIEIVSDIEIASGAISMSNKTGTYVIDGNGYTISPAEGNNSASMYFNGDTSDASALNITVTNTMFTGFAQRAILSDYATVKVTGCTFKDNNVVVDASNHVIFGRNQSAVTVENCVFENNAAKSVIYIDRNSSVVVENCLFDGNTCAGNGVIYLSANTTSAVVKDNTFEDNVIGPAGNAAVVYCSAQAEVTGNLFKDNTVNVSGAGDKEGVVVLGSAASGSEITGNAFVNNTLGDTATNRATVWVNDKTADYTYDVSGNYWGDGEIPELGTGKEIYYSTGAGTMTAETYATGYEPNAEDNGIAVVTTDVPAYNVWVGGVQITSVSYVNVFGDGKVTYDPATATLTLDGYTYSGAGYKGSAIYATDDIAIVVKGENSLTSTAGNGINAGGTISVTGTGTTPTLNISAKSNSYALQVAGASAAFTNLTMAVSGNRGFVVNENNAPADSIDIKGCNITFASGTDRALQVWNGEGDSLLTIADSTVTGVGRILMFAEGDTGDTTCFITNSTVALTDSQIESYNGDAMVEISESTVSMTGGANDKNGAFNVGARYGSNTVASVIIANNSDVTCSGQYSGINVWTWGENGPQASEIIVEGSKLTSTGSYYGMSAYSVFEGDTSVYFTNSTVNATGATSGIEICSDASYNAVGDKAYTQIDSDVTLTTTTYAYGLDIDNSTSSSVNDEASTTATIIGGSLTCNGCGLYVAGDGDSSVSMHDTEVTIDVTDRDWYPIVTGTLNIDSGTYTIVDPDDKGIAVDVGNITGGYFNTPVPEELCAEGYIPDADTVVVDGKTYYTVKAGYYVAEVYDASDELVGKYDTLARAIAAAPADGAEYTVMMITNAAETAGSTVAAGKKIVLDLDGWTVDYTSAAKDAIFITNNGTLTIKDSSENETGVLQLTAQPDMGYGKQTMVVYNLGGTFTLESGTVRNATGGGLAYAVNNAVNWGHVSTFNMAGGTISAPGGDADLRVYNNTAFGVTADCKNYVTITGGTIASSGIFVDTYLGGTYSDSFTGDNLATVINISGGTVNGLIDLKIRHPFNTSLNITGGDFTNAKLWVRKHSEYNASLAEPTEPMVYISGGKFDFVEGMAFGLAYDCEATSWSTYDKPYAVSGGIFNAAVPEQYCADGYIPTDNVDAETMAAYPYTVKTGLFIAALYDANGDLVAKYESLADAIAAVPADGAPMTITMVADETIVGNVGVTVAAGKNITLDLNGHTISQVGPMAAAGYLIKNNGTLTLKDSTDTNKDGTGLGKMTTSSENPDTGDIPSYANNLISNYGTLTIESGNYKSLTNAGYASFVVDNYSGATANITGGKLSNTAPYAYVVRMFLNSTTAENALNISGGIIEGSYAVWMQYANGNANKASLSVSGGTITSSTGYAVYAGAAGDNYRDASNIDVSFTGGTVNGNGVWLGSDNAFNSLEVTGGTYAGFGASASNTGFISGGTFGSTDLFGQAGRTDPYTVLADGCVIVDLGNGTYGVQQGVYVAQIKDNQVVRAKYTSLEAAIAAAQTGDIVEVITNCTLEAGVEIAQNLTVTGAVDAEGKPLYMVTGPADLTTETTPPGDIYVTDDDSAVTVTISNLKLQGFGNEAAADGSAAISFDPYMESTLILTNLDISDYNTYAVAAFAGSLEVVDCTIDGAGAPGGIYAENGAVLIKEAAIAKAAEGVAASYAVVAIVDTEIETIADANAVAVGSYDGSAVTIDGGSYAGALDVDADSDLEVSAGLFDRYVDEAYCATGKIAIPYAGLTGWYEVVEGSFVAAVTTSEGNTVAFASLDAALAAAQSGDTVTVLADTGIAQTEGSIDISGVTINLNGYEVTNDVAFVGQNGVISNGTMVAADSYAVVAGDGTTATGITLADVNADGKVKADNATVAIESGTYDGELESANNGTFTITGGSFSEEVPEKYVPDGYVCRKDDDSGWYEVFELPGYTYPSDASVKDQGMAEWLYDNGFDQDDIDALQEDSKLDDCYYLNCDVTVKNAGGSLTITSMKVENGEVTIGVSMTRVGALEGGLNGKLYIHGAEVVNGEYADIGADIDDDDFSEGTSTTATFPASKTSARFFRAVLK